MMLGLVVVAAWVGGCSAPPEAMPLPFEPAGAVAAESPSDPDVAEVVLPVGDPELGKLAFLDLGCDSCHRVLGDPDLQTPSAPEPGPDLGPELAEQPIGDLASSIIAPSHALVAERSEWSRGTDSRMPDLNDALTVGQLLDLVAFLRSQPSTNLVR